MTDDKRGPGRPPNPENKRVSLTIRLPRHQRDWLQAPEQEHSSGFLVEWALYKTYGLRRPKTPKE